MVNHIKMTCSRQNENANDDRYFDDQGSSCIGKMKMFPRRNPIIVMLGMPFILKPGSNEIISDSAPLRESAVCILHVHEMVTNVCGPNTHTTPPDAYCGSSQVSYGRCVLEQPNLQSLVVSST